VDNNPVVDVCGVLVVDVSVAEEVKRKVVNNGCWYTSLNTCFLYI
jgi:hypothetical protein